MIGCLSISDEINFGMCTYYEMNFDVNNYACLAFSNFVVCIVQRVVFIAVKGLRQQYRMNDIFMFFCLPFLSFSSSPFFKITIYFNILSKVIIFIASNDDCHVKHSLLELIRHREK